MRHLYTLLFLAMLVEQPASKAAAQTAIRVTDVGGTTSDLKAVTLDYTDYRFGAVLISQMRELAGVRVSRGGGEVTVTWDRIKQLAVKDGAGQITPQDGPEIAVQFVGDPILRGMMDLGRYQLPFARVRTMVVLGPSDYGSTPEYRGVEAVVTDQTGTVTHLTNPNSVAVALGDGTVNVNPWILSELIVENVDKATGNARGVIVRSDSNAKVPVVFPGDAVVSGKSALGPFEIRLSRVRTVVFSQQKQAARAPLPPVTEQFVGDNEIRVRNPNDFAVSVQVRSGNKGSNFDVPANGVSSIKGPDGRYDIYFVYSSQPDALFQGESFTLRGNGVEIQIVKVVDGNYNIRRVK